MFRHLFTVIAALQDIVAPRSPAVRALERMDTAEMQAALPAAPPVVGVSMPCIALFAYRDPRVKDLVWEIKYRKNAVIVRNIGRLLYEKLVVEAEVGARGEKILLIPIASSKKRRRERGFNQCEVICEAIMRHDNAGRFSYEPSVLEKIKNTAHQADLPREQRLKNIIGSYTVREPEKIRGTTVYLVDDVVTTGATMKEAANVLRVAGATCIRGFAIAH